VVASIPQGQVVVSSSSFHIHYLKKNKQTGGNMEVTAPVLVVKSKKLGRALTAASLLAAPFTGGASLAAGAAARAGMVGVQGARAAMAKRTATQAGKGLKTAQEASKTAQTASSLPSSLDDSKVAVQRGANHKSLAAKNRAANAPGTDADLTQFGGTGFESQSGENNPFGQLSQRAEDAATEAPSIETNRLSSGTGQNTVQSSFTPKVLDAYETENIAQQNVNAAQLQSDKMNEKFYKESIDTNTPIGAASAAGAYGFNQMEQHKKQNEANQKAEMERLEGLAEDARAKASTGTGGKVAVT
jgi:hypothetical protein